MSAVVQYNTPPVSSTLPLPAGDDAGVFAFDGDGTTSRAAFAAHVRALAARLPDAAYAVNLCEDRYRFLVAFCAAAVRGQTNLLPPTRTRAAIDEVRARYPGSYCIGDGEACGCDALLAGPGAHFVHLEATLPALEGAPLRVDESAVVAIGFTSGSTGMPTANAKTLVSLRTSTAQNHAALASLWAPGESPHVVATVPPQHMYGVELSVMLPLLTDAAVHRGRPFFPEDIARALHDAAGARLLVTTPVHLRALLASGVALPPLAGIVTATAPLPQALAAQAEARYGCEVRETFGSTETCIFASRRSAHGEAWTPYPGVRLQPQPDGTLVSAAHLAGPVLLADLVETQGDGRFVLRGRQADLLEIAGKRASLADLTRRLLDVPGVSDGVVFQLDEETAGVRRIAAAYVSATLDEDTLRAALRRSIDPVFLPRPLRRVPALPRNETGKLPRAALLHLLRSGP
ncbi:acyl-CoA synthetase [Luteimonas viscosa]|uniref:Acyl-CoA synthetase n=1 Tax=Luteimonas viscosa TaxID=1132694 RepID=A0A5D4XQ69_9GAMM|nr:AMP-binding protein [Luteimonas viscosa]TYT26786.1 acyl-CoA synthetase [Luteimonas viscosa]